MQGDNGIDFACNNFVYDYLMFQSLMKCIML